MYKLKWKGGTEKELCAKCRKGFELENWALTELAKSMRVLVHLSTIQVVALKQLKFIKELNISNLKKTPLEACVYHLYFLLVNIIMDYHLTPAFLLQDNLCEFTTHTYIFKKIFYGLKLLLYNGFKHF